MRRFIPSYRAICLIEFPSAASCLTCAHSTIVRTSAPSLVVTTSPASGPGAGHLRGKWSTSRFLIPVQYWAPGITHRMV